MTENEWEFRSLRLEIFTRHTVNAQLTQEMHGNVTLKRQAM